MGLDLYDGNGVGQAGPLSPSQVIRDLAAQHQRPQSWQLCLFRSDSATFGSHFAFLNAFCSLRKNSGVGAEHCAPAQSRRDSVK